MQTNDYNRQVSTSVEVPATKEIISETRIFGCVLSFSCTWSECISVLLSLGGVFLWPALQNKMHSSNDCRKKETEPFLGHTQNGVILFCNLDLYTIISVHHKKYININKHRSKKYVQYYHRIWWTQWISTMFRRNTYIDIWQRNIVYKYR